MAAVANDEDLPISPHISPTVSKIESKSNIASKK